MGEEYLQKSDLKWTIIRPGGLSEDESDIERQKINYSSKIYGSG